MESSIEELFNAINNSDEYKEYKQIVDIIEENGKTKYITKGDNNRKEDKEHITYEKIEGVLYSLI